MPPRKGLQMQNPELLPCPFCECENLGVTASDGSYWIECLHCKACGPVVLSDNSRIDAVKAWNRAPRPQFLELTTKRPSGKSLKCAECGEVSENLCGQCGASICDEHLIQDGVRTCVKCPIEEKGAEGR